MKKDRYMTNKEVKELDRLIDEYIADGFDYDDAEFCALCDLGYLKPHKDMMIFD